MTAASSAYSFSSQPKPVAGSRKKYRDRDEVLDATLFRDPKETCISWDKRVHRGNTYSMYTQNAIKEALEAAENPPAPEPRRKRRPKEKSLFDQPLPVMERIPVDLTSNLTAKEIAPVLDTVEAQTDEFLPEPPVEHYQPQKTGVDISTQVEDGELFIFDFEVEPILEVLINKTLEQSIMEVEEETELDAMQEFKNEWFKRAAKMMKEWEEQVAEEWVLWHKKEAVLKEKREEKKREAQVLLKIQAMAVAKAHLKGLVPNAIESLKELAFPDQKGKAVNQLFLPKVFAEVQQQVQAKASAESVITDIMRTNMKARAAKQASARQVLIDKSKVIEARRLEELKIRRGDIRIYIPSESGEPVPIGPVKINSEENISEIEGRIYEWLKTNKPDLAPMFPWGVTMCLRDESGEPVPAQESAKLFEAKVGQISMVPKEEPPPEPEEADGEGEGATGDDAVEG